MEKDKVVAFKDSSRFITNGCGLVVGPDSKDPDCVWIRWAGEAEESRERISELKEV